MNRETRKLIDFLNENDQYTTKLRTLREKHNNYKDFSNQVLYVIQEVLNTEKKFFDYPRNKIDLFIITNLYF